MSSQWQADPGNDAILSRIEELAGQASIEISVRELNDVAPSREFLVPHTRIYVSFLPQQTWQDTQTACRVLSDAGFDPVPHIPVRRLADEETLKRVFSALCDDNRVQEVMLLSGDYPQPLGPFGCVEDVLARDLLGRFPLRRVSFAGHPEEHPRVAKQEMRRAILAKAHVARSSKVDASIVTQFFFEPDPFFRWSRELRASGVRARLVAGLAGPTKLSTLIKYARRCGVGPSIRALGSRPSAVAQLLKDQGPEDLLWDLAAAHSLHAVDGIHVFCFGGFLKTSKWLRSIAQGRFLSQPAASSKSPRTAAN